MIHLHRLAVTLTFLTVTFGEFTAMSGASEIAFEKVQLSDKFYSEGGTFGDFNGDGQGDVAVGPWIYLGPDFESKVRFYEGEPIDPIGYSENFLMFSDDVNADGQLDIIVIGFPGKESWWNLSIFPLE